MRTTIEINGSKGSVSLDPDTGIGKFTSHESLENEFHKHLDVCSQCRNNPFRLCQEGAKKLERVFLHIVG